MASSRRALQSVLGFNRVIWTGRRSFGAVPQGSAYSSSQTLINSEYEHSAHNYHPIPIVFSQAKGSCIWDPEGNRYLDFLAAYSAVNQAIIVSCCGCFHGRTLAVISMSCDNEATRGFWPLVPGHLKVDFGDAVGLEKIFKENGDRIAGFLFEPIQGEAGVIIPPDGYLKSVRDLCTKYNILMIDDEIQSGLARSGRMLACDWEEVRPDVVILGKALGGGVIPVSAVLADKDIMLCIRPGEHGSTFGGNPLASAVSIASLDVIRDERLAERSAQMGEELRNQLNKIQQKYPNYIKEVRGRGLFNAVELNSKNLSPVSAYDICLKLKERGVLAKPTHDTIIRLTPPLSISLEELEEGSKAISDVLEHDLPKMQKEKPENISSTASNICDRCGRNLY
ncbi:ornithine aminotransferase, mitochondrial isoform X2 [Rosa rugosa]|uniref:ornithine aminotransferase, mitochondrial isoform X2 n=1 Tax=Rosa rugosa TaxID=74645 RepID=UPI002B407C19|nr:ornithine aminotransferase, mitochondrial isoform X2 [Rosa rugosa]